MQKELSYAAEDKYLFRDDIRDLLNRAYGLIHYVLYPENNLEDVKRELLELTNILLGDDTKKNLDFHFNKYLEHSSFKEPVTISWCRAKWYLRIPWK